MPNLVSIKNRNLENIVLAPTDKESESNYYPSTWSGFNEGWYCYDELVGVVSTYIDSKFDEYHEHVRWIKGVTNIRVDSFASLIFQCKNTVFAVKIIEHVNGEVIEDEPDPEEPDFISTSIANNFIPCFIDVFSELTPASSKIYVKQTKRLKLIDARTMEEIDPIAIASDEPTLMSEHEQFHIAVKVISYALLLKGFMVDSESIVTRFDRYPNIWFHDRKGKKCRVDVRYTNNLNDLKKLNLYKYLRTVRPSKVYQQYLAPVFIGSPNKQIYRNQPLDVSFLKDVIIKLPFQNE